MILRAIGLTVPGFDAGLYKSFSYNSFEIRLLMVLAKIYFLMDNFDIYFEMLNFSFDISDKNDRLFPTICLNLGNAYKRKMDYERALKVFNFAIAMAIKNNNYEDLDLLYYAKGTAEYFCGIKKYTNSFDRAISFCEITKRYKNKALILKNIDKYFS